jgi:hypothetical protein
MHSQKPLSEGLYVGWRDCIWQRGRLMLDRALVREYGPRRGQRRWNLLHV